MVGRVAGDLLELFEVARFPNIPVQVLGTLYWDILSLYRGILDGLREAGRETDALTSIGIDSWAIDYGLLDSAGALLRNPIHYRDRRTDGVMQKALATVPAQEIYACTGIQFLPFNTLYQLLADKAARASSQALLVPDLFSRWLTGTAGTERTNASTTQLLDPRSGTWVAGWPETLGVRTELFPPLRSAGDQAGELLPEVLSETHLTAPVPVVTVASHDTASAVVAVPADGTPFAYISCGTWSLVGVELDRPVLTEASRLAGFTNELGVDGTVRYLRNVMGLWLLQECLRTWSAEGHPADLTMLLQAAARVPALRATVEVDDPAYLPPGDLPARIALACRRAGQPAPGNQAETVRCVLDSLALAHRTALLEVQQQSGIEVQVVHVVGGGARNELLCQLTADACGLPVLAGPVEAAALGNVLVQARTAGAVPPDLAGMRNLVRQTTEFRSYSPRDGQAAWARASRQRADRGAGHAPFIRSQEVGP